MKKFLKAIAYGFAWCVSLLFNNVVLKGFRKFAELVNTANFRRSLKKCGKRTKIGRRNHFEHLKNVRIGSDFTACDGLWLGTYPKYANERYSPDVQIGNGVSLSRNCHIGAVGSVKIGNNVLMGSNILINDHAHGVSVNTDVPRTTLPLVTKGGIEIGDNVWIGDNVCILSGVTVGKNCIIGANSVVTKSFPEEGLLIAGNPARVIRTMEKQ